MRVFRCGKRVAVESCQKVDPRLAFPIESPRSYTSSYSRQSVRIYNRYQHHQRICTLMDENRRILYVHFRYLKDRNIAYI